MVYFVQQQNQHLNRRFRLFIISLHKIKMPLGNDIEGAFRPHP